MFGGSVALMMVMPCSCLVLLIEKQAGSQGTEAIKSTHKNRDVRVD